MVQLVKVAFCIVPWLALPEMYTPLGSFSLPIVPSREPLIVVLVTVSFRP